MGTIAQKLQKAQQSKEAIKVALIAKGVENVDDVMSHYAGFIEAIQSGGGGDLDFSKIGYEGTPQYLKNGLAYAEKIRNEWDENQTDLTNKFRGDKKLIFFPSVNFSKCKVAAYAFINSNIQYCPKLDTSNVTTVSSMFYGCEMLKDYEPFNLLNCNDVSEMFSNSGATSLKIYNTKKIVNMEKVCSYSSITEIPNLDIPKCTSLKSAFRNIPDLKKVGTLNTPLVTDMYELFWLSNVEIIEGLDFSSVTNINDAFHAPIKFMVIKNLGKSSLTDYRFTQIQGDAWGDESTGIVGARQSLVDSLLTYSYDRKANGLPLATITLGEGVKARLTSQEIEQITNKGYNIA